MVASVAESLSFFQREWRSGRRVWHGLCQKVCRTAYKIGPGNGSAWAQWKALPAHAKHVGGHPDDAPVGSDLFYKGTGPFGHIMEAANPFASGTSAAWSNDLVRDGAIDKVARTAPTTVWGQKYLGYGTELNGVPLPVHTPPAAHRPEEDDMAWNDWPKEDREQMLKDIGEYLFVRYGDFPDPSANNQKRNLRGVAIRLMGKK